ncbi:MAG: hypothetical protein DI572_10445 [Staphylococcus epidermidis]|nr:MAG: hypothetical protein DI572_10445 [Staphylococcus epidermidis]
MGGTNIKAALINENQEIKDYKKISTPDNVQTLIIDEVYQLAHELITKHKLNKPHIGISSAGVVDSELGEIVYEQVKEYFPEIIDVEFTVNMETLLDKIAEGDMNWRKVIGDFYNSFKQDVERAESEMEKIEIKDEPAGEDCEVCGSPMVIKMGRYGKFMACSNFPDCRNTKAIVKTIGVTCPKCNEGDVVERKSKKNRIFYGCSRYPECDFISWDKPVGRDCPKCHHYLVNKKKGKSSQVVCSNCDYEEEVQK